MFRRTIGISIALSTVLLIVVMISSQFIHVHLRSSNSAFGTGGAGGDGGIVITYAPFSAQTPNVPTGLKNDGTDTATGVTSSWTASAVDGGHDTATSYEVTSDGGSSWTVVGNVTSYAFTSLTGGTTYAIKVRAKNAGGTSAATSAVNMTATTKAVVADTTLAQMEECTGTFTVDVDADDEAAGGVPSVQFSDDGTTWSTVSSLSANPNLVQREAYPGCSQYFCKSYDSVNYSDASHTFYWRAVTADGAIHGAHSITLDLNHGGTSAHVTAYLDPVNGNDANTGMTRGSPRKTIYKCLSAIAAHSAGGDLGGGIVQCITTGNAEWTGVAGDPDTLYNNATMRWTTIQCDTGITLTIIAPISGDQRALIQAVRFGKGVTFLGSTITFRPADNYFPRVWFDGKTFGTSRMVYDGGGYNVDNGIVTYDGTHNTNSGIGGFWAHNVKFQNTRNGAYWTVERDTETTAFGEDRRRNSNYMANCLDHDHPKSNYAGDVHADGYQSNANARIHFYGFRQYNIASSQGISWAVNQDEMLMKACKWAGSGDGETTIQLEFEHGGNGKQWIIKDIVAPGTSNYRDDHKGGETGKNVSFASGSAFMRNVSFPDMANGLPTRISNGRNTITGMSYATTPGRGSPGIVYAEMAADGATLTCFYGGNTASWSKLDNSKYTYSGSGARLATATITGFRGTFTQTGTVVQSETPVLALASGGFKNAANANNSAFNLAILNLSRQVASAPGKVLNSHDAGGEDAEGRLNPAWTANSISIHPQTASGLHGSSASQEYSPTKN